MKRLFALPMIGLVLGAVAIATEIKTGNLIPAGQQLSWSVVTCIKSALTKRENTIFSSYTVYQNDSVTVLSARKSALLSAWDKSTKSEVKTAVSAAWTTYKKSMTDLKSILNISRTSTWAVYKTEVASCKWTSLLKNIDISSVRSEQ